MGSLEFTNQCAKRKNGGDGKEHERRGEGVGRSGAGGGETEPVGGGTQRSSSAILQGDQDKSINRALQTAQLRISQ